MSHDEIPIIDIASFRDGSAKDERRVATAIAAACEDTGFFTVTGHGVPEPLIAETRRCVLEFFDLPRGEKFRVRRPTEEVSRGYNALGDQALAYSLGAESPPDLQESFAIGPPRVPDDDYYRRGWAKDFFAPNLWPAQPAALRPVLERYFDEMNALAARIMRIFAHALDLEKDFFEDKIDKDFSILRLINYPAQRQAPAPGQLRTGEHSDYGTVTILRGDDTPGGLQVRHRNGGWIDLHPPPEAFVVNIGDLMMRWTNDRWVSTLHRVVNPPRRSAMSRRLSMVFFHNPNYDTDVRCLPTCRSAAVPPRYPPTTPGEHHRGKHMKARYMDLDHRETSTDDASN